MDKKNIFLTITKSSTKNLIGHLTKYARPYSSKILLGFISMGVVAATTAASAKLMKPIINDIFLGQKAELLLPITGAVFLVFLLKGIFSYAETVLMAFVGHRVIADIQKDLFNHLIVAPLSFFQTLQTGDLISRFMNDVSRLNNAVTGTLTSIGKDSLTLLFFIYVMFDEDWLLASIVFFILPIAILPVVIIGKKMRRASTRVQEQTADLTILLTQAFQGIRLIKSYCMEAYEKSKIQEVIDAVFRRTFKGVRTKAITHPVMEFLGGLAIVAVILYGGSQVIQGNQTPGAFFAFITALIMSYEPLKRLANLNANLHEQLAAAERVFSLFQTRKELEDPSKKDLKVTKGVISFQDVSFHYIEGSSILKSLHLTFEPGKKTALVGPSGGGKSTLLNLIPRFFDVTQGAIQIDEQNIQEVSLVSLRQSIALVSQEIVLFDDTIAANIGFGNPHASLEDIRQAAKAAAADEFIEALPQGYQTLVGEQGLRLSGGQRQRLSIARAFLKNAPLLLMDEPTSALDSASEQKIQQALTHLMKGRTTVIIAHRLATVLDADIIYMVEEGQITAQGTHEQLLRTYPPYQHLCKIQFETPQDRSSNEVL